MKPLSARLLPAGAYAVLVEVDSAGQAQALYRYLDALRRAGDLPGVVDLVPAARTVLVDGGPGLPDRARLESLLAAWTPEDHPVVAPPTVQIPTVYDGPDLSEVARRTGLTPGEVIAAHTGRELTVAFCGFAPGFAYLTGLPRLLHVPRRRTPRPTVRAGAVALASEFTGVYPRSSPGGWQLIGHTRVVLWDPAREPAALLAPGARVRFRAVRP